MQNNYGSYGGIISSSKKIKKAERSKKTQTKKPCSSSSPSDEKKYQTFDVSDRTQILSELKHGIAQLTGHDLSRENLGIDDVLALIKKLKRNPDYNKLIINVFSSYYATLDFSPKALIQWRKKIVNWFKSSEKAETRGGVVVKSHLNEAFMRELNIILDNLHIRCFSTLRNSILPMLINLKVEMEENGEPLDEKTCSKHWWFNFLIDHPEIKEKWSRIPLERTYNKLLSKGLIVDRARTESTELSDHQLSSLTSPNMDKQIFNCEADNFINYEVQQVNHQLVDEVNFGQRNNQEEFPQAQIEDEPQLGEENEEFRPDFNIFEGSSPLYSEDGMGSFNAPFCLSPMIGEDDNSANSYDQESMFNFFDSN